MQRTEGSVLFRGVWKSHAGRFLNGRTYYEMTGATSENIAAEPTHV